MDVLIVDDSAAIRKILQRVLRQTPVARRRAAEKLLLALAEALSADT